jgi:hypothetical protein
MSPLMLPAILTGLLFQVLAGHRYGARSSAIRWSCAPRAAHDARRAANLTARLRKLREVPRLLRASSQHLVADPSRRGRGGIFASSYRSTSSRCRSSWWFPRARPCRWCCSTT